MPRPFGSGDYPTTDDLTVTDISNYASFQDALYRPNGVADTAVDIIPLYRDPGATTVDDIPPYKDKLDNWNLGFFEQSTVEAETMPARIGIRGLITQLRHRISSRRCERNTYENVWIEELLRPADHTRDY